MEESVRAASAKASNRLSASMVGAMGEELDLKLTGSSGFRVR